MEPQQAAELLRWAAAALPTAAVLIYDPTRPHDAFGQQMLLNPAARGCPLVGIAGGAEPAAHAARLRSAGWGRAAAADMDEVYRLFLEPGPRAAAERREMLDEVEEWTLIQRHYALALGINDAAVRSAAAWARSRGTNERRTGGAGKPIALCCSVLLMQERPGLAVTHVTQSMSNTEQHRARYTSTRPLRPPA